MKKRRSPAEKKALSYQNDYINVWEEDPHQFRRDWPREKARSHRAYRRKVNQLLEDIPPGATANEVADPGTEAVRRETVKKRLPYSLRKAIEERLERRVHRTLGHFFQSPYDSAHDRDRFSAFLFIETRGKARYAQELALFFDELIGPRKPDGQRRRLQHSVWWRPWHIWLQAFLDDEPDWEPKLRAWIASFPSE